MLKSVPGMSEADVARRDELIQDMVRSAAQRRTLTADKLVCPASTLLDYGLRRFGSRGNMLTRRMLLRPR